MFPVRYRVNLFRCCYLCSMSTNCLSTNCLSTNCLSTNCLSTNCLFTNCLFTNCLFTNCLFMNRLCEYPCAYTCAHARSISGILCKCGWLAMSWCINANKASRASPQQLEAGVGIGNANARYCFGYGRATVVYWCRCKQLKFTWYSNLIRKELNSIRGGCPATASLLNRLTPLYFEIYY